MTTVPALIALFLLGSITLSALLAFWWAASDGQFTNVEDGAKTVFDRDEQLLRVQNRVDPVNIKPSENLSRRHRS